VDSLQAFNVMTMKNFVYSMGLGRLHKLLFALFSIMLITARFAEYAYSEDKDTSVAEANTGDKTEDAVPSDTIIFLGDKYYPPYEFINNSGMPDGFDVELTKSLMNRIGKHNFKIVSMDWQDLLEFYDKHSNAVIMGMDRIGRRENKYNFGPVHSYTSHSVVYRKGSKKINALSQLAGKKIIVERGGDEDEILVSMGLSNEIMRVNNYEQGFKMLSSGEHDVLVCDNDLAKYYLKNLNIHNLEISDLAMPLQKYCYVGRDSLLMYQLDTAIQGMKSAGDYSRIFRKWFTNTTVEKIPKFLYAILFVLICAAAVLSAFTWLLNKRVDKAKLDLENRGKQLALALNAGDVTVWGYDVKSRRFFNVECDYFPPEGRLFEDEVNFFHPGDKQLFINTMNCLIAGDTPPKKMVFRLDHSASGNWQYTEKEFAQIKDSNDKVVTIIGSHRDITSSVYIQKRLKENILKNDMAIKASGLVYWEMNRPSNTFTMFNDPVSGFINGKIFKVDEYFDLVKIQNVNGFDEMRTGLTAGIVKNFVCDSKMWFEWDKKWHYCTTTATPFDIGPDGLVTKYVGFRKDNTDLVMVQQELKVEMEKAKQADKLKSAFLANMSHDIRTPLNAIVGFAGLLQEDDDKESKNEYISLINSNSELLLRLVNDILDLSKIEAGAVQIAENEFDMSKCFADTVSSVKSKVPAGVKLVENNPYKECIVFSDRQRISQILTNFITNAIKYTPLGTITVSYVYENGGVKIAVSDTGIGIPEEKQYRIFQRFEKLDNFAQGTGLGLSICKAIVDTCGGKIGFTSKENQGSTFWAWIPCKKRA
jgi:ABC-type amino acid transport substrate-binding protein/two-component sensor histidine kinase